MNTYFKNLWTVGLGDVGRGLVIAVLTTPLGMLYDWATMEVYQFSWKSLIKGAVAGGLAYLMKNVFTGQNGKLLSNK